MLHHDDIFACGVEEPHASTVCSVVGVDDLIILGIVAAASIAASQISASESEGYAKDEATRQKQLQEKNFALDHYAQMAERGRQMQGLPSGLDGGRSAWQQKMNIDAGYDSTMRQAERQADMTRMNGYIQAGSTLASGIARGAMTPSGGSNFVAGAGYDGTGADIGARAGTYDLNPQTSPLLASGTPVQTTPIRAMDPSGGFQLQPQDYALLSGQDPNRYRFTL